MKPEDEQAFGEEEKNWRAKPEPRERRGASRKPVCRTNLTSSLGKKPKKKRSRIIFTAPDPGSHPPPLFRGKNEEITELLAGKQNKTKK